MIATGIQHLEWSVRALAQPVDVQKQLFPRFVCVADELALEFEQACNEVESEGVHIPEKARDALLALDALLLASSGPEHAQFWTDEALREAARWEEISAAARRVLIAMQWSATPPAPSTSTYIASDA